MLLDAGSKPAWETFGRPTGEHQASCGIPPATHRISWHSPLGRLIPPNPHTHKKTLNNEQETEN
jgi:hypothetical protein